MVQRPRYNAGGAASFVRGGRERVQCMRAAPAGALSDTAHKKTTTTAMSDGERDTRDRERDRVSVAADGGASDTQMLSDLRSACTTPWR